MKDEEFNQFHALGVKVIPEPLPVWARRVSAAEYRPLSNTLIVRLGHPLEQEQLRRLLQNVRDRHFILGAYCSLLGALLSFAVTLVTGSAFSGILTGVFIVTGFGLLFWTNEKARLAEIREPPS